HGVHAATRAPRCGIVGSPATPSTARYRRASRAWPARSAPRAAAGAARRHWGVCPAPRRQAWPLVPGRAREDQASRRIPYRTRPPLSYSVGWRAQLRRAYRQRALPGRPPRDARGTRTTTTSVQLSFPVDEPRPPGVSSGPTSPGRSRPDANPAGEEGHRSHSRRDCRSPFLESSRTQRAFDELGTPLPEVTFVVADLETTGVTPDGAGTTEIGAVKVRGGEVVGEFATLVDPGVPIPPQIVALTGITPAMVRSAPRIEQVLPTFLEFVSGAVLVAHNAGFDVSFLKAAF